MKLLLSALVALATFFAAGGAHAQPLVQPSASTRDFARTDRLVLQSSALGEQVTIRIQYPALGIHPSNVILVALVPEPDARRIAADLRKRELESSMFGVVVVWLEGVDSLNSESVAEALAGPVGSGGASRFTRFLSEELKPLLFQELSLQGKTLVAGSGVFGRVVLQASVEERGLFDEFVVVEPVLTEEEAKAIGAKASAPGSAYSVLNVLQWPRSPGDPAILEPLLDRLVEGAFYIQLDAPETPDLQVSDYVRDRAAQMAVIPPH
jgi:hypothetical protein